MPFDCIIQSDLVTKSYKIQFLGLVLLWSYHEWSMIRVVLFSVEKDSAYLQVYKTTIVESPTK